MSAISKEYSSTILLILGPSYLTLVHLCMTAVVAFDVMQYRMLSYSPSIPNSRCPLMEVHLPGSAHDSSSMPQGQTGADALSKLMPAEKNKFQSRKVRRVFEKCKAW